MAIAASSASASSFFASGCIELHPMAIGYLKEVRIGRRLHADQLHRMSEQGFQIFLQTEPSIGSLLPAVAAKLDKEIDIAPRRVEVAARGGAEELQPLHVVLAAELCDRLAVLFDERDHRLSAVLYDDAERHFFFGANASTFTG